MKALATIAKELFGLFVEDGSLAIGILIWLGAVAFILPIIPESAPYRAPILFLGLAALLAENALHSAHKSKPKK